ncbi:DNA-directed RNA polymerase subunit beta [Microbacterium horticulturae]|uniref:DNA-directed RNA polymerase subunit beta n=1 Tax=Microbacterium horticulturae TaxID=3028316 RepID=A0ABY8C265_9MICO|nr:DNA-directed RNA polymerase subunit beta [Microbacterium sp. KACC 23027]WEG09827.1 DNA-directed RNA polymerase subunit beta [Microbacterium sp. KACC 23027]
MQDSGREFHKPVRRASEEFDRLFGAHDPAEATRIAHSTATALLSRVRADPDTETVDRLVDFTRTHGIDDIAELWSRAPARSLPGSLWNLYLLQLMIHRDPATAALLYERGRVEISSADPVIAGAPVPSGPDELVATVDRILRGVFDGDFAVALDRAAAFSRVQASGATHVADDSEPERATTLTRRASRLATIAADLSASAALWRMDALS